MTELPPTAAAAAAAMNSQACAAAAPSGLPAARLPARSNQSCTVAR